MNLNDLLVGVYFGFQNYKGAFSLNYALNELPNQYKSAIDDIRACENKEMRRRKKRFIPSFTPAGVFPYSREKNAVFAPSGLIGIDIDFDENDEYIQKNDDLAQKNDEFANSIKKTLSTIECTFAAMKSVSGRGVFALMHSSSIMPNLYAKRYSEIAAFLSDKYNIVIDRSCSDYTRLRYITYDDEMYLNEDAVELETIIPRIETTTTQKKNGNQT